MRLCHPPRSLPRCAAVASHRRPSSCCYPFGTSTRDERAERRGALHGFRSLALLFPFLVQPLGRVERLRCACASPFPSSCTGIAGGALSLRGFRGGRIFRGTHLAYDGRIILSYRVLAYNVICNITHVARTENPFFEYDRRTDFDYAVFPVHVLCAIRISFLIKINYLH